MRTALSTILLGLGVLLAAADAGAQEASASNRHAQAFESIAAAHSEAAAARQDIRRVLSRDEVASVARKAGLDLESARNGVELLEGEELDRMRRAALDAEEQLAGGDTIVISTTALIIGLLVLIIILVT